MTPSNPQDVPRLDSEVLFLTERMKAQREHRRERCWGRSSDAMALYGLGQGPRPKIPGRTVQQLEEMFNGRTVTSTRYGSWHGDECGTDYPLDMSDLNACERTYEMAPAWVQERMLPVLEEFRGWVLESRNRYGDTIGDGYRWGTHEPAASPTPTPRAEEGGEPE